MPRRHLVFVSLMAVVLLFAGSGLAMAAPDTSAEAQEPTPSAEDGGLIAAWLDLTKLVWWFLPVDGDEVPDCGQDTDSADDPLADAAEELPEACYVVDDVTGPNGQVNHGSVVSAFVHSLKELMTEAEFTYDGPRGQLVREIAGSDLGKGDETADHDEDAALEEAAPVQDRGGPPDHAKAHGHGKKDKGNRKPSD